MSGVFSPFVIIGLDPVIQPFAATSPGVMAGFSPAIHDLPSFSGISFFEVMDTRPKGGHDGWCLASATCDLVKEPCS